MVVTSSTNFRNTSAVCSKKTRGLVSRVNQVGSIPGLKMIARLVRRPVVSASALAAVLALAAGCGGDDTVVVTGRVTYRGEPLGSEPLPRAQIRFIADDPSAAWMAGAYIDGGQYKVDTKGGVPVGKHTVEIVAHRPTADYVRRNGPPGPDANWDRIPQEQFLPAKYNTQTELEVTIESGSGQIVKNFDLTD